MNRRIFHTRRYSTSVVFSNEALTLFSAMSVQLTTPQKIVINTVINQWKTDGVWAASDRIWVPCLVTEQQSLLNWKNPGGTALIPHNFTSLFVSKQGYYSIASINTYLETDYTPSTDGVQYTLNNAKVIAYLKDNIQDDGYICGGIAGGDILLRPRDSSDTNLARVNGSTNTISSATNGSGLNSMATDGTNCIQKRNNTTLATTASATTTINSSKQFIYCWNDGSDVPLNFSNLQTIQLIMYGNNTINDASAKSGVEYILANL